MSNVCIDFLKEIGFDHELVEDLVESRGVEIYKDVESYKEQIISRIEKMRGEFDDEFIIDMFLFYDTVFINGGFCEKLEKIREQFNTPMWSEAIQYEWATTGESSVFDLMDVWEIGYFEKNLEAVCQKVWSVY